MSKKNTASKAIASKKKLASPASSQMEQMPIVKRPASSSPAYPGKVGQEKPTFSKERAVDSSQKDEVLAALAAAWKKHPALRLGQLLVAIAGNDKLFYIEDFTLAEAMNTYDGSRPECGELSHSRTLRCTLEKGHGRESHINLASGLSWTFF